MDRSGTSCVERGGQGTGSFQGYGSLSGGALRWRKSSWSANNTNCVEVAFLRDGRIGIRDSKDAQGAVLAFSPGAWQSFLSTVRTRHPGS